MADDQRLSQSEKKSLNDQLLQIVERGTTTHPLLMQIGLARQINLASGGVVIAPWEVDELPETWLDAFRFSTEDLSKTKDARQKISSVKSAWLSKHPTYGK